MHAAEHPDHDPRLLVDLAVDAACSAAADDAAQAALAADLGDELLVAERRRLERLHALLAERRVTARDGFAGAVMAALPATPAWQQPPLRGWRTAVLALAAMLAVTVGLLAGGTSGITPAAPVLGVARAVGDFAAAAALSGSGLVAASWRGVGLAMAAALALPERVVFGIGLVGLYALLAVLLRRPARRRATAAAVAPRQR